MTIHISRCSFGYRRRDLVLEDLTLDLPSGCAVLLGPNGAGKSTLLSLLASARRPRVGSVTLGDLNTRKRGDLMPAGGWLASFTTGHTLAAGMARNFLGYLGLALLLRTFASVHIVATSVTLFPIACAAFGVRHGVPAP